jgi:hypothetical protein
VASRLKDRERTRATARGGDARGVARSVTVEGKERVQEETREYTSKERSSPEGWLRRLIAGMEIRV